MYVGPYQQRAESVSMNQPLKAMLRVLQETTTVFRGSGASDGATE